MTEGPDAPQLPGEPALPGFRTSDGILIRYRLDDFTPPWRPGETVVLLHAAMGSMQRFRQWVPHLLDRYRVLRWDMRGHGDSEAPGEQGALSVPRMAQDLIEMLDHLGLRRVHLVGSSTGGIIGMQAAVTWPQRFASLASFAAIPGLRPSTGHHDYGDWTQGLEQEGVAAFLRRTIRQRFDPAQVEPGFVDWFVAESARNDPRFLARFVRMMAGGDFGDRLKEIRCPSLFVVPGADPVHSMENYAVLRSVPDHRFIVYEGMAHNITDALPDRCAADLRRFLDALPRDGAAP
jgi:pimeloyl-ACP methyl ester carboxylesterase